MRRSGPGAVVCCALLAVCVATPASAAAVSAQEKKLYALCKAKYGRTPKSVKINVSTVFCVYDTDSTVSEEQARAECVKQYGPSVSPFVKKVGGRWVCHVTW